MENSGHQEACEEDDLRSEDTSRSAPEIGVASVLVREMRSQQARAPKWQDFTSTGYLKFKDDYAYYRSQYGRLSMAELLAPSILRILCSKWKLGEESLVSLSNRAFEEHILSLWPSRSSLETSQRLANVKMNDDSLHRLHEYIHKFKFEVKLCVKRPLGPKKEVELFIKNLRPPMLQQLMLLQGPRTFQEAEDLALALWDEVEDNQKILSLYKSPQGGSQTSKTSKEGSTGSGTPSGEDKGPTRAPYVLQCRKCRKLGHKADVCRTAPEKYLSEAEGRALFQKALEKARGEGPKPSGGSPKLTNSAKPAPPGASGKSYTSVSSKVANVSFATAEDEPEEPEGSTYVTDLSIRVVEVLPSDQDLKMTIFKMSQDVDSARRLRGKLFLEGNKNLANIASIDALLDSGASTNLLSPDYFEMLSEDQRQRFSKKQVRVQVADNGPARLEEVPYGPIYLCFSTPP